MKDCRSALRRAADGCRREWWIMTPDQLRATKADELYAQELRRQVAELLGKEC